MWRELSWIGLSWFPMKADDACQPSLGIEVELWERGLTALGVERLESAAARVRVSLAELRFGVKGDQTQQSIYYTVSQVQSLDWVLKLLLPHLPVLLPHANL